MYETAGIAPLSQTQVSKLLNHHSVRVKAGTHHKVGLSKTQLKKHNKAKMKGTGYNLTLDPYQIANMQYLRNEIDKALSAVKAVRGGTLLIDQPFTSRQAVNTTGNLFKDPKGTLGFGMHGGTLAIDQPFTIRQAADTAGTLFKSVRGGRLLIDEPFTARQAVNTTGNFFKDPKGTLGFGLDRSRVPVIPNAYKGRGAHLNGQGFWEDVGKVAKKAGKTAVKALANEVVQYAGPTAGAAFSAAAIAAGQPQYAPAAAVFGNEFGSLAGNYVNKQIQGMGVRGRGRPKKGGNLQPAGAPRFLKGKGKKKKAMHFDL